MSAVTQAPRLARFGPAFARSRQELRPGACLFLGLVGAAAAAADAPLVGRLGLHTPGLLRFLVLASAAALAQLYVVHTPRNQVFHTALVFVIAAVLLLPPELVALMCVLQHVPDWIKERYRWYIQTFNICNYTLDALAAVYVSRLVRTLPFADDRLRLGVAALAACAVFLALNRLTLAAMLRLARGLSFRETGLFSHEDVALDFVLAAIGVVLAICWLVDPWLVPAALAPLLLTYYTQRSAHKLQRASETIQVQHRSLEEAYGLLRQRTTAALQGLAATVDARDAYTAGHSRRVQAISLRLGRELGLSEEELELLGQAALLHDIGKLGVPDAVLLKPDRLNEEEWRSMRSHAEEGAKIIAHLDFLAPAIGAIRHHHERFDGSGYPEGLKGDQIPLHARIIHLADALDSMLTTRTYRAALPLATVLAEVRQATGTQFCPRCVAAFERLIADEHFREALGCRAPQAIEPEPRLLRSVA
jgi:putative nucleotidyltransferase with HDIG domain